MIEYVRVTDDVKPRREYSIPVDAFDAEVHKKVKGDATAPDGTPLEPKYTPSALSSTDGQQAEKKKES